ncbi:50S ribosomal subunit L30 [Talaromyces stipitatus ATCC 10500]|uniref:Large ribosomal subunit protein mL46 n=1 Tax=Talaromyces stipitatus (strain ATCC 10500 / CBS 375.48 / QM 6759 / NRRL 1006) TaxID=441959 RepID=B8LYA2_TALSN|nr:mitochondrial 54S ribosomal protein YmL17/YmL30 [Talaromyces stipitatus ATCC 10500]EED22831.1 50S ribosomal subunit L30 [Talaromyces stipitatus ATCC 10500]
MSAGSRGTRRMAAVALRPSNFSVCRGCQESLTITRRDYASAASTVIGGGSGDISKAEIPLPSSSEASSTSPSYDIKAGVVLSRPPQITRDLTPFEKSFYFYQKRLNERLALPFTRYFYFKRGTPADEDWKRKFRERLTPSRDIGKYNAYSPEAWNDELLVGAVESEPEHQVEMLLRDAELVTTASSEGATTKKVEIERPAFRVTEADKKNDQKSLDRLLQRTLYLLVKTKQGYWKFPSSSVGLNENLRSAAERTLSETAGVNMNTWFVGFHPIGHYSYIFKTPKPDQGTKELIAGEKTFFLKSRIMAGQADLQANTLDIADFKWLAKEEIQRFVLPQYYSSVKNMLADR